MRIKSSILATSTASFMRRSFAIFMTSVIAILPQRTSRFTESRRFERSYGVSVTRLHIVPPLP
jgi:hypothetical protein